MISSPSCKSVTEINPLFAVLNFLEESTSIIVESSKVIFIIVGLDEACDGGQDVFRVYPGLYDDGETPGGFKSILGATKVIFPPLIILVVPPTL